jgi:hypothetical protein
MRRTLRLVGVIVLTTTLIGRSIFSDAPAPTPAEVTTEEPP